MNKRYIIIDTDQLGSSKGLEMVARYATETNNLIYYHGGRCLFDENINNDRLETSLRVNYGAAIKRSHRGGWDLLEFNDDESYVGFVMRYSE